MSHSFYKIWLHAIFSTKERQPLIAQNVESEVFKFMSNQLRESGCPVRIINGMPDHVHMLYLQNPNKTAAETIKQVKGSVSHWINKNDIINSKFAWQTGYGLFSVSESQVEKVYNYIKNQKVHHKVKSFNAEFDEFIEKYNLDKK